MGKTTIEWADKVWNPVTGCTKVSEGCRNCYAETMAKRFWKERPFSEVRCHEERITEPFRWRSLCRIFVNSMGDLFHQDVPDDFILKVFTVALAAQSHVFMILTKRPQRMYKFIDQYPQAPWIGLKNLWLGVSVEDQKSADERIPILLQIPAAIRFVSVEPMLGAVDLKQYLVGDCRAAENASRNDRMGLDWVICGGESGPGARPMYPDWARSLRDQCQAAGVPFFFKQWGEWTSEYPQKVSMANRKQTYVHGSVFYRIGKTSAGRLLDGREWNEYPEEK